MFRIFLLLSSLFICGCATFRSPDDVIAVDSTPQGADIYLKGKKVGTTPDLIKLDRKYRQQIELRKGDQSQTVTLQGRYRYKASFWPNFAFLTLAPIGWVVDYVTGSAWDYKRFYHVDFKGDGGKKSKTEKLKLAIAPPRSDYSMLSDELGKKLESGLREEYPEFQVLPYQDTVKHFAYNDFDYDRPRNGTPLPDVFYESKADVIFVSTIDDNQARDTAVSGKVYNAYSDKPTDEREFVFHKSKIVTNDEVESYKHRPIYFYVLPNTFALDFEESSTSVDLNGKSYSSKRQSTDGFWGQVSTYASVIALRRYQPPTVEKIGSWRFAFNPSVLISHSKQKFEDSPELRDLDFTVSHIDFSYGPQYTFSIKMWQFYGSIAGAFSYDQLRVNNTITTKDYGATNIGVTIELGTIYFINPNWSVRLATRAVTSNDEVWRKAIQGATGIDYKVESSQVETAGISFGYTFSDYIHPGRR